MPFLFAFITVFHSKAYDEEWLADALYSAAVGGVLGAAGGAVDPAGGESAVKPLAAPGLEKTESAAEEVKPLASPGLDKEAPVRVGRVTTIKNPYQGESPVQVKQQSIKQSVSDDAVSRARNYIQNAQADSSPEGGRGIKTILTNIYKQVFRPTKEVPVGGMTFRGKPYLVDINSNVPAKVISDPNLSAEKLALLDMLPDIVRNGEYVGSGSYMQHGSKQKKTIRYDYFEVPVTIEGRDYVATFDVEVEPNVNNYRTHKVIKMDLAEVSGPDTAPVAAATEKSKPSPISKDSVSQRANSVNVGNGDKILHLQKVEDVAQAGTEAAVRPLAAPGAEASKGLPRLKMEDFVNTESPVWNNVDYDDNATKASIMQRTHREMVAAGSVVEIPESELQRASQYFPDLRGVKKSDRTPVLKERIAALKADLTAVLKGVAEKPVDFTVNGNVLEARLYGAGIREVLEKITQKKAGMLYGTSKIFENARYLYSTPDKSGDPNIYRWNYFYTPVRVGDSTVGVRIAVRDMAKGTKLMPESQIYNWGIKKDASLDGGSRGPRVASSGVSSDASSDFNITRLSNSVNVENAGDVRPLAAPGLETGAAEEVKPLAAPGLETEAKLTAETLPTKAQQYLNRAEKAMVTRLAKALNVTDSFQLDGLQGAVRQISNEYLSGGKVSQETVDALFSAAYDGYIGSEDSDYRVWAKRDFEDAVNSGMSELNRVRRYAQEQAVKGAASLM